MRGSPFFYSNGSRLRVRLYAEDGTLIKCVDDAKGEYTLGETRIFLNVPSGSCRPSS